MVPDGTVIKQFPYLIPGFLQGMQMILPSICNSSISYQFLHLYLQMEA